MQIFVHGPDSATIEVIEIEETVLVRELLVERNGEYLWIEDVDVPVDVDITLVVAGIGPGHHVHRGPCPRVDVRVIGGDRAASRTFAPSTTVSRVITWAAEHLGLGPVSELETVDRRTGRIVLAQEHIGSLTAGRECTVDLDLRALRRDVEIIVNARRHKVAPREVAFEQIVELAFPVPPAGSNIEYTVTYRHGAPEHPKGSLLPSKSVHVREGMIFNVTATDKS